MERFSTLPLEGAIRLEMVEGTPCFRATTTVQERIEWLLAQTDLTTAQDEELMMYEEVDDYLSFLNRVVRNLAQAQPE